MPASGKASVIGKRLGKSHADSRAHRCSEPDPESIPTICRGERCGENWSQRRYRTIDQSRESGLNDLQNEEASLRPLFIGFHIGRKLFLVQFLRALFVLAFFVDKIVEQLPDAGVLSARRRLFVKPARFHFHRAGFLADRVDAQRAHQPKRRTLHESADVLAANQGNVFAKLLLKELDQPSAVPRFLFAHTLEHRRRCGIVLPQAFREVGVHTFVFLLQSNGQGEHFAFGKFVKLLHRDLAYLSERARDKSKTRGRRHLAFSATIQSMTPRKSSGSRKREKPPRPGEKTPQAIAHDAPHAPELVIITGMSGSGKASVLKAFEDLGYYCVDNLPVELIPRFAEMALQSAQIRRSALVVDVREGSQLAQLPGILKSVQRMIRTKVAFLEASDAVLMRRFSETRRPHPLGTDAPVNASLKTERRHLASIRALADIVIDTSKFNVHELRDHITERFREQASDKSILVSCVSFGFRHGVPEEADLVFDVRFLPNPHFVPEFRPLTGRHPRVAKYIRSFPQTQEFVLRISDLLVYLLPHYIHEGKSYLTIGFGCTGGQHRSVMIAEEVGKRLHKAGYRLKVVHRDMPK
jgi:RNase adapter protein RapZ